MCGEGRETEAHQVPRLLSKYAKPYPNRLDVVKDRTRVGLYVCHARSVKDASEEGNGLA